MRKGARTLAATMQQQEMAYTYNKPAAALFLGIAPATLNRWIAEGRGPRYKKIGGKLVRFRLKDLMDWAETQPGANSRRPVKKRN